MLGELQLTQCYIWCGLHLASWTVDQGRIGVDRERQRQRRALWDTWLRYQDRHLFGGRRPFVA
jgi:hypothetical protein